MSRTIGEGKRLRQRLAEPRFHQIAELAYVMNPNTRVDRKITENRSAIPLIPPLYHPD